MGSFGTCAIVSKWPTSVFVIAPPKPPTRSSTLATFEDVNTMTVTESPARGVVELSLTQRICGGASGASMRIVGVGIGVGDGFALGFALGLGLGLAPGVGLGSGVPDTPASSKQAKAKATRI